MKMAFRDSRDRSIPQSGSSPVAARAAGPAVKSVRKLFVLLPFNNINNASWLDRVRHL